MRFWQGGAGWYRADVPYGAVAQLAERLHGMQEVRGSIPLSSTYKVPGHRPGTFCLAPASSNKVLRLKKRPNFDQPIWRLIFVRQSNKSEANLYFFLALISFGARANTEQSAD